MTDNMHTCTVISSHTLLCMAQVPAGPMKDGCPCGSNKVYKVCCKKFHNGTIAPTLEETVRARYCAVIKKVRAEAARQLLGCEWVLGC